MVRQRVNAGRTTVDGVLYRFRGGADRRCWPAMTTEVAAVFAASGDL